LTLTRVSYYGDDAHFPVSKRAEKVLPFPIILNQILTRYSYSVPDAEGRTTDMKIRYILSVVVLLAITIGTGCATSRVTSREALYRDDIYYPATDPAEVKVFQKRPEDVDFIEIGEIIVENAREWEEVESIFRIKAAEFGGDAVYVFKTVEHYRTYESPRVSFHFGYGHHYSHNSHGNYYSRHHYPKYGYRHGYYGDSYSYGFGYSHGYGHHYYSYTYLTVTGIVIKYLPAE
jgi:hypothetical protein